MSTTWLRINALIMIAGFVTLGGMMALRVSGGPLDPPGPPASTDAVKLPGTPISSAPFTITSPGHYYVTKDLNYGGAGAAISISASGVTLDLGGFNLQGSDVADSRGVYVTGFLFPISIENGTVRDFAIGVDGVNGSMVKVKGITAFSNGVGILVGNVTEISDCTVGVSTQQGISVVGSLGLIQGCHVFDSGLDGIRIEGFSNVIEGNRTVRNNTSVGDSVDVSIAGLASTDNIVRNNNFEGFLETSTAQIMVRDNILCGINALAVIVGVNNTIFCG